MYKLSKGRISKGMAIGATIFMIINVLFSLYLPSLTADIINKGVAQKDIDYIWREGGIMLICSILSVAAAVGNSYLSAKLSQGFGKVIRSDIFRKVIDVSDEDFEKFGTSTLITRTTNDVSQVQNVVVMFFRVIIMAPIMLVGASFLAYNQNHELMLIFVVVLPVLALFMGVIMYFAVPLFKQIQKKTDNLNLIFREGITGVRVIRAFIRDNFEQKRFDEANSDFTKTSLKVYSIMALMFPVITLVMSITNIAIVWFGGQLIGDMTMPIGNLVAFMSYAMTVLTGFMLLSLVFAFIPRGQAAAVRINEVLDLKANIKEAENPQNITNFDQGITFNHVNFKYSGAEKLALSDIDFTVTPGHSLAIIGGTGSGKSTLVNMIPRLFDVTEGEIKLGGLNIEDISLEDLRDDVSYVPQKNNLFKGTIRDNIQYGKENATDDEIWRALRVAQAEEFVKSLPDGLDNVVEQGGKNFSGGQKQRLAIARALIKEAEVYIFDDSFSALDFKTDAELRQAINNDEMLKNKIIIIVGQRIATVANSDTIIVLEEGRQIGKGTHQELKDSNEVYQEIIKSQLKGDEA